MKKTTKPKVTIASLTKQNEQLQKELIEALEYKRKLELKVKDLISIINDQKNDLIRFEEAIVKVASNTVKVETENISLMDAKSNLLFEVKKYQDGLAKLEVLNKELKEGVDTLLKEYNDLEKNYINQSTTLIMIEGILTYGYNFFTAYSTLNEIKSILNSK